MPTLRRWDPKDPSDVAVYWFNWAWFLPEATTIATGVVTVAAGLTLLSQGITSKKVWFKVSGGTLDASYNVHCVITTNTAETFEIDSTLKVAERRQN